MTNKEITKGFDEIRQLLRQTVEESKQRSEAADRRYQETSQLFQEIAQQSQETKAFMQENARRMRETDRRIRELTNLFTGQFRFDGRWNPDFCVEFPQQSKLVK